MFSRFDLHMVINSTRWFGLQGEAFSNSSTYSFFPAKSNLYKLHHHFGGQEKKTTNQSRPWWHCKTTQYRPCEAPMTFTSFFSLLGTLPPPSPPAWICPGWWTSSRAWWNRWPLRRWCSWPWLCLSCKSWVWRVRWFTPLLELFFSSLLLGLSWSSSSIRIMADGLFWLTFSWFVI